MNELFGDTRECDGGSLGPSLTIRRNTQPDDRRVVPQSVVTIKLTYEIQPVVAAYILFNGGQSHYSPTETTPVHHTPSCLTVRGVVYVETRYLDSVRDYDRSNLRSTRTVEKRRRKIGLTISNIGRVSRKRPPEKVVGFYSYLWRFAQSHGDQLRFVCVRENRFFPSTYLITQP